MVDASKTILASHHIELPLTGEITPDEVRRAINSWLVKTFAREWTIAASGYPSVAFPHGAKDAFTPDTDDPLPPLKPPRFLPGVLCGVKYCSYLAYLHTYCANCCKQKFRVEVRETKSESGGLGLFATSKWEGKREFIQSHLAQDDEKIINFCTRVEYIDEAECSPFHRTAHVRSHGFH